MDILTMNIQYKLAEFVANLFKQVHPFSTIRHWRFNSSFQKMEQKIVKGFIKNFVTFLSFIRYSSRFPFKTRAEVIVSKNMSGCLFKRKGPPEGITNSET